MAKISLNDHAPSGEKVSFSLANAETFELGTGAKDSIETDDTDLISNANAHPWLQVDVGTDAPVPTFTEPSVKPEDDVLGRFGPNANLKPEKAEKVEAVQPLAVEAGLDQDKKVVTGDVAETLAAAESKSKTKTEKGA